MTDLRSLPTYDDDGNVRVVVESPRGARVKLAFDGDLGAIVVKRTLPIGIVFPYDWGFVAGTGAADGDPLDATLIAEHGTWPGVVVPAIPIGVVRLLQRETPHARAVRNDRVVAVPASDPRWSDVGELPRAWRDDLAAFFVRVGELAHAVVRVTSILGSEAARRAIERAARE